MKKTKEISDVNDAIRLHGIVTNSLNTLIDDLSLSVDEALFVLRSCVCFLENFVEDKEDESKKLS